MLKGILDSPSFYIENLKKFSELDLVSSQAIDFMKVCAQSIETIKDSQLAWKV